MGWLPGSNASPVAQAIAAAAVSDDDVALVWLQDQGLMTAIADFLRANETALSIQEVLAGESVKLKFNDPSNDHRTPDIVVLPNYGTIFTTSKKKLAEHGGFSEADTNVALLVSNPSLERRGVRELFAVDLTVNFRPMPPPPRPIPMDPKRGAGPRLPTAASAGAGLGRASSAPLRHTTIGPHRHTSRRIADSTNCVLWPNQTTPATF